MSSAPPLTRIDYGSFTDPRDPGEACYSSKIPRVSVTLGEADILADLVRGLSVLEVGTGIAVSTRALARTALSVVTVDVDPWVQTEIWPYVLADCPNVRTLSEIPDEMFDAVFIDANHTTAAVRNDIALTRARCRRLMIFHDVNYASVREGVEAEFQNVETIQSAHGIGIVRFS